MRSDQGRLAALLGGALLVAGVAGIGGCASRSVVDAPAVVTWGSLDDEIDFWDALAELPVVSNDDALHGLLVLAGLEPGETWDARLEAADARGWLAGSPWPAARNESATVGMIAVAICAILDEPGGVTMRVFGPSPRYCTRELVFWRIMPPRTEHQALTGLEFVDLVGRVQDALVSRRG